MCIFAVTPLVGVWIEIKYDERIAELQDVTPLVGVWIEITEQETAIYQKLSHSPCGSVD